MATVTGGGMLLGGFDPAVDALDRDAVGDSAEALQRSAARGDVRVSGPGGLDALLPPSIVKMVATILREAAQGHAIAVVSAEPELTTGQAAAFLGVSRPHVTQLVDARLLPGRKVGSHRRIRFADLVRYREARDRRYALLDEITAEVEALGLYEAQANENRRAEGADA